MLAWAEQCGGPGTPKRPDSLGLNSCHRCLGGQHFAEPARRWAVRLGTGGLMCVQTDQTRFRVIRTRLRARVETWFRKV